jgi:hypothetical protein
MTKLGTSTALMALVVWLGAEAQTTAAEVVPDVEAARVVTMRIALPLSGFVLWGHGAGAVTLIGVALSLRLAHLVEVEGDVAEVANPCESGQQVALRAGVSPSVLAAQGPEAPWILRIPLLASVQHVGLSGDGCDGSSHDATTILMLSSGLDFTYWSATEGGLNVRLLGGYGSNSSGEVSLSLGFSFK